MSSNTFIILTARNEADRLGTTLKALADAFPGAPIWVGDDGSSDGTSQIALAAGASVERSERAIGKGAAATLTAQRALERLQPSAQAIAVLCDGDLGSSAGELASFCHRFNEKRPISPSPSSRLVWEEVWGWPSASLAGPSIVAAVFVCKPPYPVNGPCGWRCSGMYCRLPRALAWRSV